MEAGYILHELWRRKRLLAVGLVIATLVAVSFLYELPSLEKRSVELGAGSSQLLVDAELSPVGAINAPLEELVTRSELYARLVETAPIKKRVARELGIEPSMITTEGPQPGESTPGRETTAEQRSSEVLGEGNTYRLFASGGGETIPVIFIFTQAPTAEAAIRLAGAAAGALQSYVRDTQESRGVPDRKRIQLSPLGRAEGGVVSRGAGITVFALAFLGTFVLWCLVVLVGGSVMRGFREGRTAPAQGYHDAFPTFPDDWTAELDRELNRPLNGNGTNGDRAGDGDRVGHRGRVTG
jgi:hypothetical protein